MSNSLEMEFDRKWESKYGNSIKRGWPDRACYITNDRVICIEVKSLRNLWSDTSCKLQPPQQEMATFLKKGGIETYVCPDANINVLIEATYWNEFINALRMAKVETRGRMILAIQETTQPTSVRDLIKEILHAEQPTGKDTNNSTSKVNVSVDRFHNTDASSKNG